MHRLSTIIAAALLLGACAAGAARPPRATKTLLLADFASSASTAKWLGQPVLRVPMAGSPGAYRGRITFPKYVKGAELRPRAVLHWDGGRGFPTRDFRPWGKVAIDAWVVGGRPQRLGFKLRDSRPDASWTTWVTLQPGRKTSVELTVPTASADMDVSDVREIWLYAKEAPETYSVEVANLRLVSAPKPPVATLHLQYPNYRGLIFPGEGDPLVEVETEPAEYSLKPSDLVLSCTLRGGGRTATARRVLAQEAGGLSVSAQSLPAGAATLVARMSRRDGTKLVERKWSLRKLSPAEVSGLRAYVDRWANLIVNGRPFYPFGFYDGFSEQNLAEMANGGCNAVINYGISRRSKAELTRYLDLLDSYGMKCIFNIADLYPRSTHFTGRRWEGIEGNTPVTRALIGAFEKHPAVLSWYLNEELVTDWSAQLRKQYEIVSELDPTRPCSLVHCNRHVVPFYKDTTDIFGMDPYPIPSEPITRVSEFLDVVQRGTRGTKSMWLVPETFAWYQFDRDAPNQDRGRIPSPQEWKTGRPPSNAEMRCMIYLGLAHGAKGMIGFSYYNMRVLPQYREMWDGLKRVRSEIDFLSPALLTRSFPLPVRVSAAGAPIHTRLLWHEGMLTLIAVNSGKTACEATFDVGMPVAPELEALFEGRALTADGSRVTADFEPLEARVFLLKPAGR